MDRHCDMEVVRGTVLTTLCVDGAAHHLVDNIIPGISVHESFFQWKLSFESHFSCICILFAFDIFHFMI